MVWRWCPPWNAYIEILTPKDDGFRRWGFGEGQEGGALLNGIGALIKESPQACLVPSACEHAATGIWPGESSLGHAGTLASDFQPPELWEISLSCLKATPPVLFWYSSLNRLRQQHLSLDYRMSLSYPQPSLNRIFWVIWWIGYDFTEYHSWFKNYFCILDIQQPYHKQYCCHDRWFFEWD